MTDTYQAVYDAVRSRIGSCDTASIIRESTHLDASHAIACVQQDFSIAAYEMHRPSVLYRPSIGMDGNKWCALYGDDLMHGISGFGDTPAEAMADFDKNWREQKTPMAR